jgi:hypothetical protein
MKNLKNMKNLLITDLPTQESTNLLTQEELARFKEMTQKEHWKVDCVLRGKIYVLDDNMIIQGNRFTSTALLFFDAQMLVINDKVVLKNGDKKYLYIESYRFVDDLAETPTSKTYKVKIKTYHFEDMLHPDNIETIEQLQEMNKDLLVDASRLPDETDSVKIKVKTWSYISHSGYDRDNDFATWKHIDYSSEYGLKIENIQEIELFELLGYERKKRCKKLR